MVATLKNTFFVISNKYDITAFNELSERSLAYSDHYYLIRESRHSKK